MKLLGGSLRSQVTVMLVLVSLLIVLVEWDMSRQVAVDTYRDSLGELVSHETQQVMSDINQAAQEMGQMVQQAPVVRHALLDATRQSAKHSLDQYVRQSFSSSGRVSLVQVYLYDQDFQLIGQSSQGPWALNRGGVLCSSYMNKLSQRDGVARMRVEQSLCASESKLFHVTVLPIGGFELLGYLQLVVDPAPQIAAIEQSLNLPVLLMNGKDISYRSANWSPDKSEENVIHIDHPLKDYRGEQVMTLSVQRDLAQLNKKLADKRNVMMLMAVVIMVVAVSVAIWLLKASMLTPLAGMIKQLHRVRDDRRLLRVPVELKGNKDIQELVSVFNDMAGDLAKAYEQYEEVAFTDQLTTLPNRALFLDRLQQMILLSERHGDKFSVLLLDLDNFKEVNDTLGHGSGDLLLCQVGMRLKRILRASSTLARISDHSMEGISPLHEEQNEQVTVARLGGDEFAILLPNVYEVDAVVSIVNRIKDAIEPPVEIGEDTVVTAASIGLSFFPEHGEDGRELLRKAEVALYAAKSLQTDFSIYDASLDLHDASHLSLKAELKTAIEEGQLVLFYQPKLNFKTGCVTGVEALARWQHPHRGMIPPDQFIPMSEQRGLIGPLTEWAIETALKQCKRWQQQGIELQVAVNLSSRVLYDMQLPNKIEQLLISLQMSPASLCLEITEQAMMQEPKRALVILERLDEMGIALSIDDFGTGYSSLGYLKQLPVDEIKIDKTFVLDMHTVDDDAKIVHATIDLAHNLGLKVVAEGVENETALGMLESLDCDYAQGYYLSRPVPADELVEWLSNSGWACKV